LGWPLLSGNGPGFFLKKILGKKGKRKLFGVPMRILTWESKFGLKEMTAWVILPRGFTQNCFTNALVRI
jgi:hypothetical protein